MTLMFLRKTFPYFVLFGIIAAILYATNFGTLPRADFTFNNTTEIKTVDPAKATGEPEGRIIEGLFEGLLRRLPAPGSPPPSNHENTLVTPQFAAADRMQVSEDGKTYTFHIRETAKWSDGTPLLSHDFVWSWQRMLNPETASEYAYQLHYVKGAKNYTAAAVQEGGSVEVEIGERVKPQQPFPRGDMVRGVLAKIERPIDLSESDAAQATVYVVQTREKRRAFSREPLTAREFYSGSEPIENCLSILPDFDATVGIKAIDDHTLQIVLNDPTPYFPELLAFYPLYPVQRACVETYGSPDFTQPQNLVTNGAYTIGFRRIRDRLRMVKNPHYWNAAEVQLETIDAMAISSDVAALNMYETGQIEWTTNVPPMVIPELQNRDDYGNAPLLATYFYRVNCTVPPLDDVRVRRALNMAIDKQKICELVLRAGEHPATSLVPPLLPGYTPPTGAPFDPEAAKKLLADAGYPSGKGMRKIEILHNTHETHQVVAEVVQADWKRFLGIDVELRPLEWGTYLDAQQKLQYDVSRAGWTGDYLDPNTFIDMFVTGGENNQTGWSNPQYDALVESAKSELDPTKRLAMLHEAEAILLEEQPILPIAVYTSKELTKPYVSGHFLNVLKVHPLHLMKVDKAMRNSLGPAGNRASREKARP